MKKIYSLGLALFVGVAAMAADNGPHSHVDNRSPRENTTVRNTQDGRWNGYTKVRPQDSYYSSRYGNDSWGRRNDDRNDRWAYARDRYDHNDRDRGDHDRGYDRNDQYDHNVHSYDQNIHGYGQNNRSYGYRNGVQRRYY